MPKTKTPTIMPIILNLATGFGLLGFRKTDVGGAGIKKDGFEAEYPVVARFAYSKTVPGTVVIHALNVPLESTHPRILGHLKFYQSRLHPRHATPQVVAAHLKTHNESWETGATEDQIAADIEHLLAPPTKVEIEIALMKIRAAA